MQELTAAVTSPGIIAAVVWEPLRGEDEGVILEHADEVPPGTLLALDAVADPGNVGSLIRAADAFGLGGVLLGRGCVESTNPKVVRGSVGSLFSLPMIAAEVNLRPVLTRLRDRGWTVYRAEAGGGMPLHTVSADTPWILLLGSEARGVQRELDQLGKAIHIELTGAAESLNVAMAGGIVMYGLTAAGTASS
jgi:TrmH family RNA methyltransferase